MVAEFLELFFHLFGQHLKPADIGQVLFVFVLQDRLGLQRPVRHAFRWGIFLFQRKLLGQQQGKEGLAVQRHVSRYSLLLNQF